MRLCSAVPFSGSEGHQLGQPTLHNLLDEFFRWTTKIAEWPIVVLALVYAFYLNVRTGIAASVFYGIEWLIVTVLKNLIAAPRPGNEIGIANMHKVDGVDIYSHHSFPSGHTASAFVGFGLIAIFSTSKIVQVICAFMAALIGYSRLYLGEHYLRDVLAGAIIALLVLYLFTKANPKFQSLQFRKK